MSDEMIVSRL